MVLMTIVVGIAVHSGDPTEKADVNCGTNCLYLSLRAFDLPPSTIEELQQTLGYPSNIGYSLDQLDAAARHHGANTLAVQTSVENLQIRPRPFPSIAHVNGSHFFNIRHIDD